MTPISYASAMSPRDRTSHLDDVDRVGTSNAVWFVFHSAEEGPHAGSSILAQPSPSPFEAIQYVRNRLGELSRLPNDWDGNGGVGASDRAHRSLLLALQAICDRRTVFPFLAPTGDGGVIAEWRASAERVEIECEADGTLHVYATTERGSVRIDDVWSDDVRRKTRRALLELSARVSRENPAWRRLFGR